MNEVEVIEGEVLPPAVIESHQAINLFGDAGPADVVTRATEAANALAAVIEQKQLYSIIQRRKHVSVEGWTLLGSMLGVFPVVEWSRKIDDGWEARVVVHTLAGAEVGAAEAMCSRKESTWSNRDDYAIRSMAQTRAVSKALRHPLGFIMTLAGYEATPEAEIPQEPRGQGAQDARAQEANLQPQSWADIQGLLMAYGDDGATYQLFGRFGAAARKLLFGEEDLSAAQKGMLFEISRDAAVSIYEEFDPGKFPPPSEEQISKAWAKYLDGAVLAPTPKEGSNE